MRHMMSACLARFRTIQVEPEDLRALPGHPEPAVSWHSGFRGGAHARPKTTAVHHAARQRGGFVAARGARATGRAHAAHRFAVIQAMAPLLRVEVSPVNVRDPSEIRHAVEAFARSPNGGLIVTASALAVRHGDLIITLAARHKLPAVYYERHHVTSGGVSSLPATLLPHHPPGGRRRRLP